MCLFSFRKLCDLFLFFYFILFYRNGKKDKRWEGRLRESIRSYTVVVFVIGNGECADSDFFVLL